MTKKYWIGVWHFTVPNNQHCTNKYGLDVSYETEFSLMNNLYIIILLKIKQNLKNLAYNTTDIKINFMTSHTPKYVDRLWTQGKTNMHLKNFTLKG